MDNAKLDLKKTLVRKQSCFAELTPDESEKLAALFCEKDFNAGEIIVTEGDTVDSVFLIIEGTAEVRQTIVKDDKLETKTIATIGPGESVGLNETGFYSLSGRRTATVVAITNIRTLKLNIAEFHGFALAYSHVNEVMRHNADTISNSKM